VKANGTCCIADLGLAVRYMRYYCYSSSTRSGLTNQPVDES
jgi:hypothetical protein